MFIKTQMNRIYYVYEGAASLLKTLLFTQKPDYLKMTKSLRFSWKELHLDILK